MDNLKFGLGFTALLCSAASIIGGISALIPCIVFCAIPIVSEIRERQKSEHLEFGICVLCGQKFRINDKMTSGERRICNLCINEIFKYSKTVPELDYEG